MDSVVQGGPVVVLEAIIWVLVLFFINLGTFYGHFKSWCLLSLGRFLGCCWGFMIIPAVLGGGYRNFSGGSVVWGTYRYFIDAGLVEGGSESKQFPYFWSQMCLHSSKPQLNSWM